MDGEPLGVNVCDVSAYYFYIRTDLLTTMSSPADSTSPHLANYPLETLTPTQRHVFQQFLEARQASYINLQEPISFARLLVRDKPGMIMAPLKMPSVIDYTPTITTEEIVDAFDLEHTCLENDDVAIARTPWRLDLYMSPNTSPGWVGIFLGYPEQDIEHYISTDPPYTEPEDLVADGIFNADEVAYITYIPQRNEDSIEGYKRAISEGKTVRDTIETWARTWDLPGLVDYSDWIFEKAVTKYTP